jgi:hypothetical protein
VIQSGTPTLSIQQMRAAVAAAKAKLRRPDIQPSTTLSTPTYQEPKGVAAEIARAEETRMAIRAIQLAGGTGFPQYATNQPEGAHEAWRDHPVHAQRRPGAARRIG